MGFAIYHDAKKALPVIIALILGYLYVIYTFILLPLLDRNTQTVELVEKKWNQIVDFEIRGFPVLKRFVFFWSESLSSSRLVLLFLQVLLAFLHG